MQSITKDDNIAFTECNQTHSLVNNQLTQRRDLIDFQRCSSSIYGSSLNIESK